MVLVANNAIVRFLLPKSSRLTENLVDFARGKALPTVQSSLKCVCGRLRRPHDDVHVIRHDHIASQLVSYPVKVMQGPLHDLPQRRVFQSAASQTLVQPLFHSLSHLAGHLIPYLRWIRIGPDSTCRDSCEPLSPQKFELIEFFLREGIVLAKRDEICC